MNRTRALLLTLLCLAALGCPSDPATPPPSPSPTATPAVTNDAPAEDFGPLLALAKAIEADPANIEALLTEAGYTIGRFEDELMLIARSPERAADWVAQMN